LGSNRLYTAVVIVGWLASMTWLVADRILPPFFGGDAPSSLAAYQRDPVAWRIEMDGDRSGVAVMQATPATGGVNEVHSVVRLDAIHTPDAAPFWLAPTLKSLRSLSLTMRSIVTYDATNSLASFSTGIEVNHIETPIRINGRVEGDTLHLVARVGGHTKRFEHAWTSGASVGGDLTPAARLLPLYEGRRWTHEVFSPLASPSEPLERVEAEVTELLRITHNGANVDAWKVEYRSTERTGSTEQGRLRASLYVGLDGVVLKQETLLMGSKLSFSRLSDADSQRLADELLELDKRATTTGALRAGSPAPDEAS